MRILFVCTGNICRSPLGELLFRMYTTGTSLEVDSAGTHSLVGHKIDASSAALLTAANIDSSEFRSKQLTRKIADECDLILCFEETQQHNIVTISPSAMRYTFTLTDFSNMCAYCAQQNMIEGVTLPERLQSVIAQATTVRPTLPSAGIIADPFHKDFFCLPPNRGCRRLFHPQYPEIIKLRHIRSHPGNDYVDRFPGRCRKSPIFPR